MAQTLTKAAKSQYIEKAQDKKRRLEPAPVPIKVLADEPISFPRLMGVSAMEPTFETHAAFLGDPRFSHPANNAQKAGMVAELQGAYGNQYVQRLVKSMKVQTNFAINKPEDQAKQDDKSAEGRDQRLVQLAGPGKTMDASRVSRQVVRRSRRNRPAAGRSRGQPPIEDAWITGKVTIYGVPYSLEGRQFHNQQGQPIAGMEISDRSFRAIKTAVKYNIINRLNLQLPPHIEYSVSKGVKGDLSEAADGSMFKAMFKTKETTYPPWWVWVKHGKRWRYYTPVLGTKRAPGKPTPGKPRPSKPTKFLKGYAMVGGGDLRKELTKYVRQRNPHIWGHAKLRSNDEIDLIYAICHVESGGQLSAINTYDLEGISVGFAQTTFSWGSIYKLYNIYDKGRDKFKKHEISFKAPLTVQVAKRVITYDPKRRKHRNPDFSNPDVMSRFFRASLEPEVIAAQILWLRQERLGPALKSAASSRRRLPGLPHLSNPAIKALLTEYYNAAPTWYRRYIMPKIKSRVQSKRKITALQLFNLIEKEMERFYKGRPGFGVRKARRIHKRILTVMKTYLQPAPNRGVTRSP